MMAAEKAKQDSIMKAEEEAKGKKGAKPKTMEKKVKEEEKEYKQLFYCKTEDGLCRPIVNDKRFLNEAEKYFLEWKLKTMC